MILTEMLRQRQARLRLAHGPSGFSLNYAAGSSREFGLETAAIVQEGTRRPKLR